MEMMKWAMAGGHLEVCKAVLSTQNLVEAKRLDEGISIPPSRTFRAAIKDTMIWNLLQIAHSDNEEMLDWYLKEFDVTFDPSQQPTRVFLTGSKLNSEEFFTHRPKRTNYSTLSSRLPINDVGLHCLAVACKEGGDTSMAESLLRHGVSAHYAEDHRVLAASLDPDAPKDTVWGNRVKENDWESFSKLIDLPTARAPPLTPLEYACKRGDLDLVLLLLNSGAYLSKSCASIGSCDFTPMWIATHYGHTEVVKQLVRSGASPNLYCKAGPPWVEAYYQNHTELIEYFLGGLPDRPCLGDDENEEETESLNEQEQEKEKGKEKEKGDEDNDALYVCDIVDAGEASYPPLADACARGNLDFVRFLLRKGARVNFRVTKEMKELADKKLNKPNRAVEWREGTPFLEANAGPCLPLNMAADDNKIEIVKALMASGAKVNAGDSYGLAALHCACVKNSLGVAEFLIQSGADVALEFDVLYEEFGRSRPGTPLCCASESGSVDAIRLLMRYGAPLSTRERPYRQGGWAGGPLYRAAEAGNLDAVRCLIEEFHADPNEGNDRGWTVSPLWAAVGVIPHLNGQTARSIGQGGWLTRGPSSEKDADVAQLVFTTKKQAEENSDNDWKPRQQLLEDRRKVVEYLLKAGADDQLKSKKGDLLLHYLFKQFAGKDKNNKNNRNNNNNNNEDEDEYYDESAYGPRPVTPPPVAAKPTKKPPINPFDRQLQWNCSSSLTDAVPFITTLIKHGNCISFCDENGATYLHLVLQSALSLSLSLSSHHSIFY